MIVFFETILLTFCPEAAMTTALAPCLKLFLVTHFLPCLPPFPRKEKRKKERSPIDFLVLFSFSGGGVDKHKKWDKFYGAPAKAEGG